MPVLKNKYHSYKNSQRLGQQSLNQITVRVVRIVAHEREKGKKKEKKKCDMENGKWDKIRKNM